jgi:hypothetical protein
MGNNTWDNLLDPHAIARGTAKNTFTAYQEVYGTAASAPLPQTAANELKVGSVVDIEAWGEFSTTLTPTLQIGAIYNATAGAAGGTALAQSAAITTGSGAASWPWHYHACGRVTAVGTSGVLYIQGNLDLGTSLSAFSNNVAPVTAAARSVTIDTTIAARWGIGAAFSASAAANQIIVDNALFRVVNQGKT